MQRRCAWVKDEYDEDYHDHEWGKPLHDERALFEFLILEGMQAGLSWNTILKKRENFRRAFDNFDYYKIANYDEEKIQSLLQDASIIRNRLKIHGAKKNAQAFLNIQQTFSSFDTYIWSFVNNTPIINTYQRVDEVPTHTPLSDNISCDLKKRGFVFVGSIIMYSYMQAIGMVNDHMIWCCKHPHNQ